MKISAELLNILACPKCKNPVVQHEESSKLRCENCHLEYPVRDSIPVMLLDEAESY